MGIFGMIITFIGVLIALWGVLQSLGSGNPDSKIKRQIVLKIIVGAVILISGLLLLLNVPSSNLMI